MSFRLEGNGYTLSLIEANGYYLDLKSQDMPTKVPQQEVIGRDGAFVDKNALIHEPMKLVLSGYINAGSVSALQTAYEKLVRIINSKPNALRLYNSDDIDDYSILVRKTSLAEDRSPRGGKTLAIEIGLIAERPYWEKPYASMQLIQIPAQTHAEMRQLIVEGQLQTPPVFIIEPTMTIRDPTITFYGKNLIRNSDFSDDLTNWTASNAAISEVEAWYGKKSVKISAAGYIEQDEIPLQQSVTYKVSVKAKRISGTPEISIAVYFYLDDGTLISADGFSSTLTQDGWLDISATNITSPATTVYCRLRISTDIDAYVDAAAIQITGPQVAYAPSSYTQFAITGDTTFTTSEILKVDMENYEVKKYSGGSWTNILHLCNGIFFDLLPIDNILTFNDENNAAFDVTVKYKPRAYEV